MGSPASSHAVRGASVRPGAVAGVIRLHTEGEVGTWPASALDTITRCDRMNRLSVARVGVAYMSDRTGVGDTRPASSIRALDAFAGLAWRILVTRFAKRQPA